MEEPNHFHKENLWLGKMQTKKGRDTVPQPYIYIYIYITKFASKLRKYKRDIRSPERSLAQKLHNPITRLTYSIKPYVNVKYSLSPAFIQRKEPPRRISMYILSIHIYLIDVKKSSYFVWIQQPVNRHASSFVTPPPFCKPGLVLPCHSLGSFANATIYSFEKLFALFAISAYPFHR